MTQTETINLVKTDDDGTEVMDLTIDRGTDGPGAEVEVRIAYAVDDALVDNRIAFAGASDEYDEWLRRSLIDWRADGWREA